VARRAGHTSTSFTQDRYGHLYPGTDEALSERLDALVAQSPSPAKIVPLHGPAATGRGEKRPPGTSARG
jgi:hypothetical protein